MVTSREWRLVRGTTSQNMSYQIWPGPFFLMGIEQHHMLVYVFIQKHWGCAAMGEVEKGLRHELGMTSEAACSIPIGTNPNAAPQKLLSKQRRIRQPAGQDARLQDLRALLPRS